MTIQTLLILSLFVHWFADFVLQTHKQATLKSSDNSKLAEHVGIYSAIWLLFITMVSGSIILGFKFAMITFIAHFMTDYTTSRINKYFFDKKDYHNGFVGIGFDQILHYLQLYFTFKYLI